MRSTHQKVLVAIDGSETAKRVLDHVQVLAALHDSEAIVYHVRPKAYAGASTIALDDVPVVSTDDAAKKLSEAGLTAHAVEEDAYWGHIANAIVDAAERYSVKAIVIGTHGRSRMSSVFLGSVAYKVLHLANSPVLVIP